ncbi:MAG: hypothetical protein M3271_01645, partial [Actinomycetota bacterium]|nr:hypothetical protein [Actinomycetota bacterium]
MNEFKVGSRILAVLTTAISLTVVGPPAVVASDDAANSHTVGGIDHGWDRRHHTFDGGYHFHGWTGHGHGSKYVAVWHVMASHLHCDKLGNGGTDGHLH